VARILSNCVEHSETKLNSVASSSLMSEVVSELRSLVASSLFSRAARILVPISRMLSFDTLRYSEILSVQTKLFDMYSLKRSRVFNSSLIYDKAIAHFYLTTVSFIFFIMLASEAVQAQSRAVKRISSSTRVSGTFGPLIDDPSNRRRGKRAQIFGTVLHALDKGMYKVQFDDGTCQDVYAKRLCIESCFASILPDIIVPRMQDDPQRPPQGELAMDLEEEAIQENLQDRAGASSR
jgi:hypothetical protein